MKRRQRPTIHRVYDDHFLLTFSDIERTVKITRDGRVFNMETGLELKVSPRDGSVTLNSKDPELRRCFSMELYHRKAYHNYLADLHPDHYCALQEEPGYCVTRDGRLWSVKRCQWIVPTFKDGVWYVAPSVDNEPKSYELHRLVARHFCANPKGYAFIKFLDGNIQNCHADNLKWVEGRKEAYRNVR